MQRSPRRSPLPCRASKGFGSGSDAGSSNGSKGGAPRDRLQDALRESRALQLSTSDMLAKLLQAEDPAKVMREWVALCRAFAAVEACCTCCCDLLSPASCLAL